MYPRRKITLESNSWLNSTRGKDYLRDLSRRTGTWAADKRKYVSKQDSEYIEIGHGTLIQIWTT